MDNTTTIIIFVISGIVTIIIYLLRDSVDVREFEKRPSCIKCGDDFNHKRIQEDNTIKCECATCGHEWYMKSKDWKEKQ